MALNIGEAKVPSFTSDHGYVVYDRDDGTFWDGVSQNGRFNGWTDKIHEAAVFDSQTETKTHLVEGNDTVILYVDSRDMNE